MKHLFKLLRTKVAEKSRKFFKSPLWCNLVRLFNKSNKHLKKSMFIVRYRWIIISATILITAFTVFPLLDIRINADFESYFPETMLSRQNNNKINAVFGNEELLMVILSTSDVLKEETLLRIENLSNAFSVLPGIKRVFSLAQTKNISSDEGAMIIDPVLKQIPKDIASREKLREEIKRNDLAWKMVVSEDFKHSLIILSSDRTVNDEELLKSVNATIDKFQGTEVVNITGQAFLRDDANRKISRDLLVLLPLGILLMFAILWISFREFRGVFLPLSVVVLSIIFSLGLLSVFGWDLSLVGILIPIMMIAVANNYGVYFVARYQDLNASNHGMNLKKIVQISVKYLSTPIILCGLTTISGILGLAAHLLLPARQVGIITAMGITYALALSLLFIPAAMSLLKNGKPHRDLSGNSRGFYAVVIAKVNNLILKKPEKVLISFIVVFIFIASGLIFLKISPDSNKVMPEKHQFNRAIRILDNQFGGSKMITVMIKGDARNAEVMRQTQKIENNLKLLPNVGSVMGLPAVLRKMSCALNDSTSPEFGKIPETGQAIAQYLEIYNMNSDAADIEQFVDFSYENLLLVVKFKAESLNEIQSIVDNILSTAEENKTDVIVGGYCLVEKEMSDSILRGQIYSLIFAFFAILILLSLIFRSVTAGLIGSVPLVFAVFCTFGIMGWLGIELNIVTALLSSISIGLGVDFTIHIFWRIKWELALNKTFTESIVATLKTIGRGIIINAFSVMIGFSVLFVSIFPIIRSFAVLIIISLLLCLVSALVLIPAICLMFKPEFLKKI